RAPGARLESNWKLVSLGPTCGHSDTRRSSQGLQHRYWRGFAQGTGPRTARTARRNVLTRSPTSPVVKNATPMACAGERAHIVDVQYKPLAVVLHFWLRISLQSPCAKAGSILGLA